MKKQEPVEEDFISSSWITTALEVIVIGLLCIGAIIVTLPPQGTGWLFTLAWSTLGVFAIIGAVVLMKEIIVDGDEDADVEKS